MVISRQSLFLSIVLTLSQCAITDFDPEERDNPYDPINADNEFYMISLSCESTSKGILLSVANRTGLPDVEYSFIRTDTDGTTVSQTSKDKIFYDVNDLSEGEIYIYQIEFSQPDQNRTSDQYKGCTVTYTGSHPEKSD